MRNKVVVLDPGHGGRDPGAVSGSRHEAEEVLRLSASVAVLLRAQGLQVYATRTGDDFVELSSRPQFSGEKKANVFVSLHRNSFFHNRANGTELWVHPSAPAEDTALAKILLRRLEQVGVQSSRGVKQGAYVVLTASAPATLLELGFISNPEDNRLFERYFEEYAQAIAQGICEFLEVPYRKEALKGLYRVQTGAFETKGAAQDYSYQLKQNKDIDSFVVPPN